MMETDAEIGREGVHAYVTYSCWDEEFSMDDDDYAALVQHIREAIRGDIEREALAKLLEQARWERSEDPGMQDTVNWISGRLVTWGFTSTSPHPRGEIARPQDT